MHYIPLRVYFKSSKGAVFMKLLKIHYVAIFLASLYTINSYSAAYQSGSLFTKSDWDQFISTRWPHAQKVHQVIRKGSIEELGTFFKENSSLIKEYVSLDYFNFPLAHCIVYRQTKSDQDLCDAVQTLINCGADVNDGPRWVPDANDYLPIVLAVQKRTSTRLLDILFSHGARIPYSVSESLLHSLIVRIKEELNPKLLDLMKIVLEQGDNPLIKNRQGHTCFELIHKYRNYTLYYSLSYMSKALGLLNEAETLLKTKYLKPTKITKTDKRVHLTYELNQ
jgi:hypothetical protein